MLKLDHIGYAVKKINKAQSMLESLGYVFERLMRDEQRGIDIVFGTMGGGYRIELISPAGDKNPVSDILKKNGPTPYHLCYVSNNFEKDIEDVIKVTKGKVVIPPKAAVAFGGRRVVFLYSLTIGLIELVEE